jgi:hypothetical protein
MSLQNQVAFIQYAYLYLPKDFSKYFKWKMKKKELVNINFLSRKGLAKL